MPKKIILTLLINAMATSCAWALDFDFFGSLRVQGESVKPDNTTEMDSYYGFRDAYSRLGFKANQELGEEYSAYVKLELPLDIPNKAVQDPWDQEEDIRIAKFGVRGGFGEIAVGQMWLPYYNAIAYPVDMFSTYYSGFATYSVFRRGDTLAYHTPKFRGLSGAIGFSNQNGATEVNGDSDDRLQATVSYDFDTLKLSGGLDELGGAHNWKIWGTSLAWQATSSLYIGAKYEVHESDIQNGFGTDGDSATNVYAGYTIGKNTIKGMIADVDNYGESILHLGWDYQYLDDLKFFMEYYSEEETAAITEKHGGFAETCRDCSGGYVVAVGFRFDFDSN